MHKSREKLVNKHKSYSEKQTFFAIQDKTILKKKKKKKKKLVNIFRIWKLWLKWGIF